jgi:hypothetical protein
MSWTSAVARRHHHDDGSGPRRRRSRTRVTAPARGRDPASPHACATLAPRGHHLTESSMRATFPNVLPLVAAALLAATPAAAQRAVSARVIAPDLAAAGNVRPVATYQLSTRSSRLPERITVADSAGGLVASFRLPGDRTAYPMLVVVMGSDLVLQGETPAGILTLELFDANASTEAPTRAGAPKGRWHVDAQQGDLLGRAAR